MVRTKTLIAACFFLVASALVQAQGIGSAKDLQAFIEACNAGKDISQWYDSDSTVFLSADLDLSKVRKLPRVETFKGVFDGRGHCIKGWKATGGLFHFIADGAEVRNLIIDSSCSMQVSSKSDEFRAGFIADTNEGVIRNCVNRGSIKHSCDYAVAPIYIGGICGYNQFVILGCRNDGKLFSDVSGDGKESVSLDLGGIAGGSRGRAKQGNTIARCENTGEVSAISSLSSMYIGGICGNSGPVTIKYCINRGVVKSEIRATEDGSVKGIERIGGIAGQAKADIIRCDNFGSVSATGECGANVAGICGIPHSSLVIADCMNFGSVTSTAEQPSHTGGIAGNIGRPVRIRGCINCGEIRFDGISSRARSTAGGIVGNTYVVKDAKDGAYVRNCVNHGSVYAGAGGNKYDATNRNAIHAAGIVAYAEGRGDLRSFVKDCSSDGQVTCVSGRKGQICATTVDVVTGGSAPDDFATPVKAADGVPNVTGRVTTPEGQPIEGIVVTDGRQCVKTGADGSYAMTSDLSEARFVYLSLPATVNIPMRDGVPAFFRRIPRYSKAVQADFVLTTREPAKDYTVMMIADPQVRPYGVDGSMEAWATSVAPDAEAFRASCKGDVYSINLGDLVYNYMNAWDDYMDIASMIKCPTFNVIGNHDYDQGTLFETEQGNVFYETYVGPEHYSFDLGDIHYLVFNTILYDRPSVKSSYSYGVDDRTLEWMKADLSYIPKDKIIVTCTHHNPFKTPNSSPHGSHNVYSRHYEDYLALLSSYREVYAWNGHNHTNFYYNYKGKKTKHGAPNIQCISVTRCTGALRFNAYLGADGEPQGYMVLNVAGDSLSWYYKSVGHGRDMQMRAYPPQRTSDGCVLVNIWNWSEGWSMPQWCEGGVPVAEMQSAPGVDPDYYDLFQTVTNKTTRKYCKPSDKAVLFKVKPSPGVNSGTIRVTDMFGVEYSLDVSW
ncbi:MAG: calcineurin-like phosphoesterase C-terminal domain-containing protein [Bacteroidales bacterium]|nr:calcineurin-like phosphoesterase C-terminal domain-containing protein [Bacteroidales bacterium]